MIDFDEIDEIADERVKAGDDLDEAALAAISCADGPSSKRNDAHEELSLDELLGRSQKMSAATIKTVEEERPAKGESERARQRNLYDSRSTSSQRDTAEDPCRADGTGDEPDAAAPRSSWNPKPQGSAARAEARSKRLSLCELSPSWTPQAPPSADEQGYQGYDASQLFAGLPTETTAAEATSAREEISSSSSSDDAAAAASEKAEPEPAAAPAPEPAPAGPQPSQWPARLNEAHFRILGAVLPMRLPREGMTPQEVAQIWQEDWGVAYARNLRFQAPDPEAPESESSSKRWLNPREDTVPCSPDIVQLEGKAAVLSSLALSLRQHDERLKERSGAEGARRRLAAQAGGQAGGPDFGPRVRSAAAGAKRRVGPPAGRGTPFNRRLFGLAARLAMGLLQPRGRRRPGSIASGTYFFLLLRGAAARLRVSGSDLYDGDTRIKFKGIGATCTEYMTKLNMDDAGKGEWPGHWAYAYCFGGPPSASSKHVELNKEPENVLRYLLPDSRGGKFRVRPAVSKVKFEAPHDEVVHPHAPEARPIIRIPMTGSLYLYETNRVMYQEIIDRLVQAFTSQGVAVVLDLHWNCPDTSEMQMCTGAQAASMALRHFGDKPGAVAFWDAISKKYAGNELVLYELFNEPWIMEYDTWYGGSSTYAGMKDMYEAVRRNAPEGIVVIGGKDQYALDAQSGLAFHLQYKEETGSYPTGVLWNVHPYVGLSQGLEHSLSSALRLALALRTIGPVIFTEFGQYCCGGSGDSCAGHGSCGDEKHGAFFVHNVVNMAEQYDISWIGWAWRGAGVNNAHRPCLDGMAECSQPDMRDVDNATGEAVLTDGSHAGADWRTVWARFVAPENGRIQVEDVHPTATDEEDAQPAGFLPRPCISDKFNLGIVCGWSNDDDVLSLSPSDFTKQSIYTSILPGLPGKCEKQGCGDFRCDTYTGPCQGKGSTAHVQQPQTQASTTYAIQPALGAPAAGGSTAGVGSLQEPGGVLLPPAAAQATQAPALSLGGAAVQSPGLPPLVVSPPMAGAAGAQDPSQGTALAGGLLTPTLPGNIGAGVSQGALIPATAQYAPAGGITAAAAPQAPAAQRPLATSQSPAAPATTPAAAAAGGAEEAFCCFSWSQTDNPCCSCRSTSRTKPGDWCGASKERCSGCSGGYAHFCTAGCAAAATIQRDALFSDHEPLLEEPAPRAALAAALLAAVAAVAVAAGAAVPLASRVWRAEDLSRAAASSNGGRPLQTYEPLQPQAP